MLETESNTAPGHVLAKALLRGADRLRVTGRELASVLGCSEATVSRLSRGRGLDPESKQGELGLLFLRMVRSLDGVLSGDVEAARAWFDAENRALAGRPRELVTTVEGLVRVIEYLDAMRGKL